MATEEVQQVTHRTVASGEKRIKAASVGDGKDPSAAERHHFIKASIYQLPALQWLTVISLVFGGCCSNVSTLEKLVKAQPQSGNIITFAQFLFISLEGYCQHFSRAHPGRCFIKPNHVPLRKWAVSIMLFFIVSTLNNMVWEYSITVPLHIIFRSSGTGITMLIGYLWGKRFSRQQVFSTVLLTLGCVVVTLSTGSNPRSAEAEGSIYTGILLLSLACILAAAMQLYNEHVFKTYGNYWREGLFYQHFLSLPIFMLFFGRLRKEFHLLWDLDATDLANHNYIQLPLVAWRLNWNVAYLASNVFTQYFCVKGVNMMAGVSSALTLNIFLLIRKIVSLLLSIYLFNNTLSVQGWIGCAMVFGGAGMYSYCSIMTKNKAN
ncbi:hypothetical protein BABINDRAFT_54530 [Babjeviella inositovora NRRL Y-12698]|uniref:Sugar phosphate transporter domain-containing protein n=1 Tax=Babjeviella inositovora NRRL Y-12698 TaxID=984486 RepID=A0A1E3QIK4_9ASCO|nr:uncharacterized protein BABINDRAFT_54530 [Babjeviella inositovora NRRL Y-12698]ODQ77543.1 hypothetical protein BABINDRAFT_54530 [Babjeviella inositovora NRRL Y-12698]